MRKTSVLVVLLILLMLVIQSTQVFAEEPIKVIINGDKMTFDQDPVLKNGATLVPLRAIFEKLGLIIGWDNKTQEITGINNKVGINLKIGNIVATVNGVSVILDEPAIVQNGHTLIPIRFISESIGAQVDWDSANNTININDYNLPTIYGHNLPVRIVGNNITNIGTKNILSIDYVNFFYNLETKEIKEQQSYDAHIIGLDVGETQKSGIPEVSQYIDYYGIFLGTVVKEISFYNGSSLKNSGFEKVREYYTSPEYIERILQLRIIQQQQFLIELNQELKLNNNIPLKIVDASVSFNSIGTPEVNIIVKNLTTKTIDAFEMTLRCYDTYDRPVTRLFTNSNIFNGIAQDENLEPGDSENDTWNLTLYDNTTKVKNVKITSVHFKDGSVWKQK